MIEIEKPNITTVDLSEDGIHGITRTVARV